MSVPPPVEAYCEAVEELLHGILGDALVGLYLHGSGAMGGWHERLSDIDLLAVVDGTLTSEKKSAIAAVLADLAAPGAGLEFSIVALSPFEPLLTAPKFELHVTTGAEPKVVDGAGHPGDSDLVMHFAVCRERGLAIFGPPPNELFPEVPRRMLLEAFHAELAWGLANAPARYAVLNACRAWAFAKEGRLLSKVEGGEWAVNRGFEPAAVGAALAAQRGDEVIISRGETERVVDRARSALRVAIDADGDA